MNVAQLLMQDRKQQPDASEAQIHQDQLAALQKQFLSMQQLMVQMAGATNSAATLSSDMLFAQFLPKLTTDAMPKLETNEQSPSAQSNTKTFSAFAIDSLTATANTATSNKRDTSSDIDTVNEDEPHSPNGRSFHAYVIVIPSFQINQLRLVLTAL